MKELVSGYEHKVHELFRDAMFLSLFSRETHRQIGSISDQACFEVTLVSCDSPMIKIFFRLIYQLPSGDPLHAAEVLGWLNLEGISPRVAVLGY